MSNYPVLLTGTGNDGGAGDPDVALPGSGFAVPRGVEAVFQYNGFTFNDQTVIDKFRVINIEGLDDAEIRDIREENPATDGETAYNSFYGGRTLVFTGRIEAYGLHKMRDMQVAFRSAFIDLTEKPLYFLTGEPDKDHYINCRKFSKIMWSDEQKHLNHFYRDFQLTLRASNPRFLRYKKKEYEIDPDIKRTINIINEGNYTAEPLIRVHGGMENIEFRNDSRELSPGVFETFKLKTSVDIADGDFYEINLANKTVRNKNGENKFGDVHADSDWIRLNPGNNSIFLPSGKCTTTSENGKIEIESRDSWI